MENKLYDGRWQKIGSTKHQVLLENIYNHNKIVISYRQFDNVKKGLDTISHIISRRIPIDNVPITNTVKAKYTKSKFKYAQRLSNRDL